MNTEKKRLQRVLKHIDAMIDRVERVKDALGDNSSTTAENAVSDIGVILWNSRGSIERLINETP